MGVDEYAADPDADGLRKIYCREILVGSAPVSARSHGDCLA